MNFTFRNNVWKGEATNSIVPTNARPFTNDDTNLHNEGRMPGRPNPIKHWRKQLQPRYHTKASKQVSIDMINAPSSVVYIGSADYSCETNNSHLLKENITLLNDCDGVKYIDLSNNNTVRCHGGSNHIRRSASTNLSTNYYRNYSKYLQAKCRTHEQNSTLGEQNTDGTYQGTKCSSLHMKCNKPIIHKPSNAAFLEQRSFSAAANTLRKRHNAMTNNSASLKNAYGNTYVHKREYYPDETPYHIQFIKGDNTSTQLCNQTFNVCTSSS